jgi:hypothetical protein
MVAAWPWAATDPANPLRALLEFTRFPFTGEILFEGRLVPAADLPARYLPELLLVTTPEIVLLGLAAAVLLGVRALGRDALGRLASPRGLGWVAIAASAVLPVLYFVLSRPVAYNGLRHFLFILPPTAVLAAAGLDWLLARHRPAVRAVAQGVVAAGLLAPVVRMVELHPAQYAYFNEIAGGTQGALGRYELDYWGVSLREATVELSRRLEEAGLAGPKRLKVVVCADDTSAAYFFPPYLELTSDPAKADLEIGLNEFYCPLARHGQRLLEVTRDGAPLAYVTDVHPETGRLSALWPTAGERVIVRAATHRSGG